MCGESMAFILASIGMSTANGSWTLLIGSTTSPEKHQKRGDICVEVLGFYVVGVEGIGEKYVD